MPRNKGHKVSRHVELRTAGFGTIGRSSREGGLIFLPRDSCGFIMGGGHLGALKGGGVVMQLEKRCQGQEVAYMKVSSPM